MVLVMKVYLTILAFLLLLYTVRHFVFSHNRLLSKQKMYYNDIISNPPQKVTVIVPMHNEEDVIHFCLDSLIKIDYDKNYLQIIPVDDNSTDKTGEIVDGYAAKYPYIQPIHRHCENRGKPAGLNDAIQVATGDIIVVFDADYRPNKNILKSLTCAFLDPEVGAVMGRVVPYNTSSNLLTRLLNMERSGGYQVDQQARYNLNLVPQYGGTVGGFRRDVILELGGFNTAILAEDTELTFRLITNGYRIAYANTAECYEESPETWSQRAKQIRRWSRGHNQVLFHYFNKTITSPYLTFIQKTDSILLLLTYAMPLFLLIGQIFSLALFLMGKIDLFEGIWLLTYIGIFNSFGNFAPFYQIGTGLLLDGVEDDVLLLPLLLLNFYFYMYYISRGFFDAIVDVCTRRTVTWDKTKRFVNDQSGKGEI